MVPNDTSLKQFLFQELHDSPLGAHQGVDKTVWRLKQTFTWPGLETDVRRYIRGCDQCQRNKPILRRTPGLLQPLPIPLGKWTDVSMDFITKLPKTSRGHDSILVVVDRFTKWAYMFPVAETIDAPATAKLFFDRVVTRHGLPRAIVSDRDTRFLSSFWQTLWATVGTKLQMSTAYHPQTDGQTEVVNKVITQTLRAFIGPAQTDWDLALPGVEFAYNTAPHSATHMSPFFLNYGHEPSMPTSFLFSTHPNHPAVTDFVKQLQNDAAAARQHLHRQQVKYRNTSNASRRDQQHHVGEQVLLSNAQLPVPGQGLSRILREVWTGPFRVLQKLGPVNYRLDLPPTMHIHPIFHVSKLRPYTPPTLHFPTRTSQPVPPIVIEGEEEYEVEAILGQRRRGQQVQFLVKWAGYPTSDNTWEYEKDLRPNASEVVEEFLQRIRVQRRRTRSTTPPILAATQLGRPWGQQPPIDRSLTRRPIDLSHTTAASRPGSVPYQNVPDQGNVPPLLPWRPRHQAQFKEEASTPSLHPQHRHRHSRVTQLWLPKHPPLPGIRIAGVSQTPSTISAVGNKDRVQNLDPPFHWSKCKSLEPS